MIEAALADAGADATSAVMIGDTTYDMNMAKAAGVTAIGVAWGYHAPEELIAAGADFVATHPREVAEFMKVSA
jgi:phosphoglycolate phosphatase